MKANKVTVIRAAAEIQGRADNGFAVQAGGETYVGKRLVIASGSETTIPPVPGLKEGLASGFVVTNREVLDRKELPQDLVVIGRRRHRPGDGLLFRQRGRPRDRGGDDAQDCRPPPTRRSARSSWIPTASGAWSSSSPARCWRSPTTPSSMRPPGKSMRSPVTWCCSPPGAAPSPRDWAWEKLSIEMDRAAICRRQPYAHQRGRGLCHR